MRTSTISLTLLTLVLVGCSQSVPSEVSTSPTVPVLSDDVSLTGFASEQLITSPFTLQGLAPGTWYSEGQLTVELVDDKGQLITLKPVLADGEWMTEDQVPFSSVLEFTTSAVKGFIRVHKSNPSGLPENAGMKEFAVSFK